MARDFTQLIRFDSGEFPNYILGPLRELATLLEPFEVAVADTDAESELMAFFEILDIDDRLSKDYVRLVTDGGRSFYDYAYRHLTTGSPSQRRNRDNRFTNAFARLSKQLHAAKLPLTSGAMMDMAVHRLALANNEWVSYLGYAEARKACENTQQTALQRQYEQFGWYEIATKSHPPQTPLAPQVFLDQLEILRHMSLDFNSAGGAVAVPRVNIQRIMATNAYVFVISKNDHPLGLAKIHVFNEITGKTVAKGNVSRVTGDICFAESVGASINMAFANCGATSAYADLRAVVIHCLFSGVAKGTIIERAFIDGPLNSDPPEVEPTPVPETVVVAEPNEQIVPVVGQVDEPNPSTDRKQIAGRSKYGWKNIVRTFRTFYGVSLEWGGKHPRLVLGNKSATFLNPNTDAEPSHCKAVTRQALKKFGIDEREFVSYL